MRTLTLCLAVAMTIDVNAANGQVPGAPSTAAPAAVDGAFRAGSIVTDAGELDYKLYVPAALPPPGERALVVMLHGCTQDADDFARGTRMNAAAARDGFVVLWPQQRAANHPQKCWNWYASGHSRRGAGEVSRLHTLIARTIGAEEIDPVRVYLVGVSAGGAMAVNYAVAHPEHAHAVAVHSAPGALVAGDVATALAVMKNGPAEDTETLARRARDAMGAIARAIPLLAIHGAADAVVSPRNLDALAAQWRGWHALIGEGARVETRLIDGLGHAWSGGSADGTFTNPSTPSATQMVLDFFRSLGLPGGR
ncbi:MAG: PHB depolymerase family esterase [Gemmatimonadota bacterium]